MKRSFNTIKASGRTLGSEYRAIRKLEKRGLLPLDRDGAYASDTIQYIKDMTDVLKSVSTRKEWQTEWQL